ncbi:LysR family transcriptional regulator [Achromobacter pestifer]|nr:LysR family transcriptional regulator [Achromobacter pestifer]
MKMQSSSRIVMPRDAARAADQGQDSRQMARIRQGHVTMDILAAMRIYLRIVARGTFSRAAIDLDMGQPAISERIAKLEAYLGVQLLRRNARSLLCTEAGKAFHDLSLETIQLVDKGISSLKELDSNLTGTLRIAAPVAYGEMFLSSALIRVRASLPELQIDLQFDDGMMDPSSEDVDLLIRPGVLKKERAVAFELCALKHILVCSPAYAASGQCSQVSDLAGHPFIGMKEMLGDSHLSLLSKNGEVECVEIRAMVTANHWHPVLELVKAEQGIGVLPQAFCASALSQGKLLHILPHHQVGWPLPIYALVPERRTSSLKIKALIQILRQSASACVTSAAGA